MAITPDITGRISPVVALYVTTLLLVGLLTSLWVRRRRRNLKQASPCLRMFPPSRRHVLPKVLKKGEDIQPLEVPIEVLQKRALPTTRTPDFARKDLFTPTGFTTGEVEAIGAFPDYAELSGVRHPQPCGPDFDISRAVFRPFRPFRWRYHQHMGIYMFLFTLSIWGPYIYMIQWPSN